MLITPFEFVCIERSIRVGRDTAWHFIISPDLLLNFSFFYFFYHYYFYYSTYCPIGAFLPFFFFFSKSLPRAFITLIDIFIFIYLYIYFICLFILYTFFFQNFNDFVLRLTMFQEQWLLFLFFSYHNMVFVQKHFFPYTTFLFFHFNNKSFYFIFFSIIYFFFISVFMLIEIGWLCAGVTWFVHYYKNCSIDQTKKDVILGKILDIFNWLKINFSFII